MIVVDASAAFEMLLNTRLGKKVADIAHANEGRLHAPHLIDLEVLQALRRHLFASLITQAEAATLLDAWLDAGIERHPHTQFLRPAWRRRNNLTAYDAAYVALAEALGAMLVTCDRRLGRAPDVGVQVEVIQ